MDTGTFIINFEAEPDTDAPQMMEFTKAVEQIVKRNVKPEWLISMSSVAGSEPGVKSFGASRVLQHGQIIVNTVDRFQRDESVFEIEDSVRIDMRKIPGLIYADADVFGATPLNSLRGTVDLMISGPDPKVLDRLADETLDRVKNVGGLTGLERSWQGSSRRINLNVSEEKSRIYGLTADEIAHQVAQSVGGTPGGNLRVTGENPIPVWVRLKSEQRSSAEDLAALQIRAHSGKLIPLTAVATPEIVHAPTAETHQALLPTVDVLGFRSSISTTQLHENIVEALKGFKLPRGYTLSYEGEYKQLNESFGRLIKSLLFGLALLYLMLVIVFKSFFDPFAIMASLPLAVIGAAWAMMLADKHSCMPSFMGLILLMGIIVKNGILLVDFAKVAMEEGKSARDAILQAVQLRTRPILMTAAAAAVGMIPIAMEWAVGIERLSPLAVVAIGGLITGTFLTLLAVPVFHFLIETKRRERAARHAVQ